MIFWGKNGVKNPQKSVNRALEVTLTRMHTEKAVHLNTQNKRRLLLRLFIFLFSASLSVAVLPGSIVNVYGLFGEMISYSVSEDKGSDAVEERQACRAVKQIRGINIYNVWFEVWICIICLIFISYMTGLPGDDTIVSLKVRMDD